MALTSVQFWYSNFQRMAHFFRQDSMNTVRTWLKVAAYFTITPGMLRRTFLPYLNFFRPGFHPWSVDDRRLIAAVERRLQPTQSAS
jgi:hypothetical protein